MTGALDMLAVWIFAYAVQSSAAAGLVAYATRWFRSPVHRARLWTAALLLPVLTAGVQATYVGAAWSLGAPEHALIAAEHLTGAVSVSNRPGTVTVGIDENGAAPWVPGHRLRSVARTFAALWLIGALAAVVRLVRAWRVHRLRFQHRMPLSGSEIADGFADLAAGMGVRGVALTLSPCLDIPTALPREVCLPERALRELPRTDLEAVLTHELAHIRRRDPLALRTFEIVRVIGWFQPLVARATRGFQREAEFCCDDAVRARTGGRLPLARALTTVAAWGLDGRGVLRAAVSSPDSLVHQRVCRLLMPRPMPARRWAAAAGVTIAALVAALCLLTPGLRLVPSTLSLETDGVVLTMQRSR